MQELLPNYHELIISIFESVSVKDKIKADTSLCKLLRELLEKPDKAQDKIAVLNFLDMSFDIAYREWLFNTKRVIDEHPDYDSNNYLSDVLSNSSKMDVILRLTMNYFVLETSFAVHTSYKKRIITQKIENYISEYGTGDYATPLVSTGEITVEQYVLNAAKQCSINPEIAFISNPQALELFSVIVHDYVNQKISVDDLSTCCEIGLGIILRSSQIYSLLELGIEISWYIRHSPMSGSDFIEDLIRPFAKEALSNRPQDQNTKLELEFHKTSKAISPETDKTLGLLKQYATKVGSNIIDTGKITNEQVQKMLNLLMTDFQSYQHEVEDICRICNILSYSLPQNAQTLPLIEAGAAMNWNFRHNPDKAAKTLDTLLKKYSNFQEEV